MAQTYARNPGMTLAPVVIRLALGLTFVWAGWGKIDGQIRVQGEDAAILANLGLIPFPEPPSVAPSTSPAAPLPSPHSQGSPVRPGDEAPRPALAMLGVISEVLSSSALLAQISNTPVSSGRGVPALHKRATAADFPDDIPTRQVWGLSLLLYRASHPDIAPDGTVRARIWPAALCEPPFPMVLAMGVAIVELIGGVLLLIGWLTRPAALSLAAVMLGAIWLDQLGPAWQSGSAVFGVLPAHSAYDERAWMPLLWQLSLFCGAVSLVLAGSGRLGVDWAFRRPSALERSVRPRESGKAEQGEPQTRSAGGKAKE